MENSLFSLTGLPAIAVIPYNIKGIAIVAMKLGQLTKMPVCARQRWMDLRIRS
jgi:hypothetical protein